MSRDGGDAAALEAALEARLLDLQAATAAGAAAAAADRQAWYADAYGFLQLHGGEHWWCQHAAVTEGGWAGRQAETLLCCGLPPPPPPLNATLPCAAPPTHPLLFCCSVERLQAWQRCCATTPSSRWCRPSGASWRASCAAAPTA